MGVRLNSLLKSDGTSSLSITVGMSTFESCYDYIAKQQAINSAAQEASDGNNRLIQCVSDHFEIENDSRTKDVTRWLLVLTGSMVFFMQIGFAMLCAGCVRRKNVRNTMLKNLLDACGAAVAFYSVGYAFAFGGQNEDESTTFIGRSNFFQLGNDQSFDMAFWFFEYTFSAASCTIVAGTLAERSQMLSYLLYSMFVTSFVYPIVAHAVWSRNGFLSAFNKDPFNGMGALDFSGSGVVHLTGGTTALVATYILGARKGRFFDSHGKLLAKPREFPGHSMALQLMGALILWFGWYGFNAGSALLLTETDKTGSIAALAVANSSLAGACGVISAMFTHMYFTQRVTGEYQFDLPMAMNGGLSGLVAITASCGFIETWAACCVGLISGWLYIGGNNLLLKLHLDDAVNAIPVHFTNGIWGMVSVGLFSSPRRLMDAFGRDTHVGWFYSLGRGSLDATLFLNQFVAILFIISWNVACMLPFFVGLNYMGWFRTTALEEMVGLDMAYHGGKQAMHGEAEEDGLSPETVELYKNKQALRRRNRTSASGSDESQQLDSIDEVSSGNKSWNHLTTAPKSRDPPGGSSSHVDSTGGN